MTEPTCQTCRFWKAPDGVDFSSGVPGLCRIRSAFNVPAKRHDDWCGEHEPRVVNSVSLMCPVCNEHTLVKGLPCPMCRYTAPVVTSEHPGVEVGPGIYRVELTKAQTKGGYVELPPRKTPQEIAAELQRREDEGPARAR